MIGRAPDESGSGAIGFLPPEESSPEGEVRDDVDNIEGDEKRPFSTSHPTPGEEQRGQPRHPDEVWPVESHHDPI